jgi:adenine-specific DNA-methyltransferase
MPKKVVNGKRVASLKHKDKRTNIPTEELRDFVADDERKPKTVTLPGLLYARDPSLDPQLVWKGKDEQDRKQLEVPAVPIYIQEKIHPHALIEDLRAQAKKESPQESLAFFADFNGIKFEDLVDFYTHKDGVNWSNRLILGDSLMVMTSLAEKEGLKGKVQMIYMDPPYGIKFGSNWQVSTRKRDVKDGKVEDASREPEVVKAFRDTWKLGIHSYLSFMRDRLVLSRDLLTDSGSIFVQIGDENVHLVRNLLDEVFGSSNYVTLISFNKSSGLGAVLLPRANDFIVWYAKDIEALKFRQLYREKVAGAQGAGRYNYVRSEDGSFRVASDLEKDGQLKEGDRLFTFSDLTKPGPGSRFEVEFHGQRFKPEPRWWGMTARGMERTKLSGRIVRTGTGISFTRLLEDFPAFPINNVWTDIGGIMSRTDPKIYVVQTSPAAIQNCMLMATDPGDLVLDPTCGSGTTAYVAEQWGRRWITIDTSRVALALARTRLMAARFPYYLLADSPEGRLKEAELTGSAAQALLSVPVASEKDAQSGAATLPEIKKGFVYERVPHVTLKSIANNEEIDTIHTRWHEKLGPMLAELNLVLKQRWEEWQIPPEPDAGWPQNAKTLCEEWWKLRRERQKEIDAAIARHAETEILFDQPYEDPKRVRVSGPFTVESLSPHRVLAADEESPAAKSANGDLTAPAQFEPMIIDNLRKAGVQNTVKNERLKFDHLEPYAGLCLHAAGEYTESGKTRRVAVCIGPEHGTVGPDLVKEAAKEAVQGVGFDLLLVCGFAFDPHVSEETKRYGKLTVLTTRMNPDLSMGDELLKKTGAGNLFMIFGEPDIDIKKAKDGKLTIEIKGLDVYDPTTGQIRSHSTDDIACWFIDTNYNGESFFVRHAYFTGADEPYEKLKRALRAEIDEAAWSALYSTKSRPFDPPKTGKIAVKVINHYGDEVLKVYQV